MYCAVVTGDADEGSILIEVNTAENTESSPGTGPQRLLHAGLLLPVPKQTQQPLAAQRARPRAHGSTAQLSSLQLRWALCTRCPAGSQSRSN